MLGYLDALIAALSIRDVAEAERLLAHPLARLLPEEVRAEAVALSADTHDRLAAPLRTLQLRHQTAELLRDAPATADRADRADRSEHTERAEPSPRGVTAPPSLANRRGVRHHQMELPLSA
jgi:hypothetical protein